MTTIQNHHPIQYWRGADGKPLRGEEAREAIDSFRPHRGQSSEQLHDGFLQTQRGARLFNWEASRLRETAKTATKTLLLGGAAMVGAPLIGGPVGAVMLACGSTLALASVFRSLDASTQAREADSHARSLHHKADLYLDLNDVNPPIDSPTPPQVELAKELMNEVGQRILQVQELDGSKADRNDAYHQVHLESVPVGSFHNQYLTAEYQFQNGGQYFQASLRPGGGEYSYRFDKDTGNEVFVVEHSGVAPIRVEVKPGGLPTLSAG